jgi:hypothetical protein
MTPGRLKSIQPQSRNRGQDQRIPGRGSANTLYGTTLELLVGLSGPTTGAGSALRRPSVMTVMHPMTRPEWLRLQERLHVRGRHFAR